MGLASQTELGAVSYQKRVLQNQIIGETRAVAANPRLRTSIEMGVDVDGSCMDEGGERERELSETGLSHVRSVQQNLYLETVEKDIFLLEILRNSHYVVDRAREVARKRGIRTASYRQIIITSLLTLQLLLDSSPVE